MVMELAWGLGDVGVIPVKEGEPRISLSHFLSEFANHEAIGQNISTITAILS